MIEAYKINKKDDISNFKIFENRINITVLITSISQREITIETAYYYSDICTEVVLVDEEEPCISEVEIKNLSNKGIKYIPYSDGSDLSLTSTYDKRLIAANHASNKYLVHSNHDERYTYKGLKACIEELENDEKLTFCVGQCIAVRKNKLGIHYTRSYENLCEYLNMNEVDDRLYYHAQKYAPIGHYGVWRRDEYINASKKTVSIHNKVPSTTMMEEVIFELAADLMGNSKAVPELFWIRNRINPPSGNSLDKGQHIFSTIKSKLLILFIDLDVDIEVIFNNLRNSHFAFIKPSFSSKTLLFIKRAARIFIKKKQVNDIYTLLNNSEIKYEENDLSNVLKSMKSHIK